MAISTTLAGDAPAAAAATALLIARLTSDVPREREHALQSLVMVGGAAVGPLTEALSKGDHELRWEAARALAEIGDPAAGPALVAALEDPSCDVRWVAGVGLIALDRRGLVPLLRALVERASSRRLRQGAHHVLYGLSSRGWAERVAPILSALEDIEPAATLPPAARSLLASLKHDGKGHTRPQTNDRENPETR